MTQQRACMKGSDRLSLPTALLHSSKRAISDAGNDAGADPGACRCLCQSHPARCQLLPVSLCSAPSQPGGLQAPAALLSRLSLPELGGFGGTGRLWLKALQPSGKQEHSTRKVPGHKDLWQSH